MTETLLIGGVIAAVVFPVVFLIEGALRPGYHPTYHMVSALALGERGWIQTANFLQVGVGTVGFSVGVHQVLKSTVGAGLVALFGLGAIVVGVFPMDPMRGYPPGTLPGTPAKLTWQHLVHDAVSPLMFLAVFGACLTLSGYLPGPWRWYTLLTAGAGLALLIATAISWRTDTKHSGLVQRCLILLYCGWIALLGIHLLNPTPLDAI